MLRPFKSSLAASAAGCAVLLAGCHAAPPPSATPATPASAVAATPPRPTTPPISFKLFHQTDNSLTLVTDEHATDDQIAAILYQLHDAAKAHTFATLHLPQAFIDKRDPIVWFHIYRGPKCASEKYTTAKLPCGASYHAAADYTLGGFTNHNHDDGVLYTGEDHETHLWNSN